MRPDSDEPADRDLRSLLQTLHPKARDDLRRVLIHDQADRDAIFSQLVSLPVWVIRRTGRLESEGGRPPQSGRSERVTRPFRVIQRGGLSPS
jgi:hypothetical protein